jgi:hypothetical protein
MNGPARVGLRCLGILQIAIAALSTRAALFSLARLALEDAYNPLWIILNESRVYQCLLVVGMTLDLGATTLALVSGLGLLGMRRWAWTATVAFCVVRIVSVLIQSSNYYFNLLRPHILALEQRPPRSVAPAAVWLEYMVPMVLGLVYPAMLLIGALGVRHWHRRKAARERPRPPMDSRVVRRGVQGGIREKLLQVLKKHADGSRKGAWGG